MGCMVCVVCGGMHGVWRVLGVCCEVSVCVACIHVYSFIECAY